MSSLDSMMSITRMTSPHKERAKIGPGRPKLAIGKGGPFLTILGSQNNPIGPDRFSHDNYLSPQVYYGSLVTDPTDAFVFGALTEHWIHPGGPKREAGRYHIPSQFLTPGTRLSTLIQAVEGTSPPLSFTAEICGLYYTPLVCCIVFVTHRIEPVLNRN